MCVCVCVCVSINLKIVTYSFGIYPKVTGVYVLYHTILL